MTFKYKFAFTLYSYNPEGPWQFQLQLHAVDLVYLHPTWMSGMQIKRK